jgi:hypothetical protein
VPNPSSPIRSYQLGVRCLCVRVQRTQVAALSAPAFQQLMSTLAFGLTVAATDAEVATCTVDALAALCRFHLSEAQGTVLKSLLSFKDRIGIPVVS